MARSSEAAGDSATARVECAKFIDAWQHGNQESSELSHAHKYLAEKQSALTASQPQSNPELPG
jgi:hypothetical protein